MIIDSHAHLADQKYNNIDSVIKNAKTHGVDYIISIGCSLKEAENSLNIAKKYSNVFSTIGLYPHDNGDERERKLNLKERLLQVNEILKDNLGEFTGLEKDKKNSRNPNETSQAKARSFLSPITIVDQLHPRTKVGGFKFGDNKNIVAIGECGLDFTDPPSYEIKRDKKDQEYLFREQIKLAKKYGLPVVIHSRDAVNETIKILQEELNKKYFKAVWHCYTEDLSTTKVLLDLGIFFSFTGILTYKNADNVRQFAKYIPINRIMVETDSPYLVPYNARKKGVKINEPMYVIEIIEKLVYIKNLKLEETIKILTENTIKFFNLPIKYE